jgi:hypothetical protein
MLATLAALDEADFANLSDLWEPFAACSFFDE